MFGLKENHVSLCFQFIVFTWGYFSLFNGLFNNVLSVIWARKYRMIGWLCVMNTAESGKNWSWLRYKLQSENVLSRPNQCIVPQLCCRSLRWPSSGMLRRVVSYKLTEVSFLHLLRIWSACLVQFIVNSWNSESLRSVCSPAERPMKRQSTPTGLHGATSLKTFIFIHAAMRTWNLTYVAHWSLSEVYLGQDFL
jgi:hypothetical protein